MRIAPLAVLAIALLELAAATPAARAQESRQTEALPPWRADPTLAKAIATIRPAEMEATVRALVACGTRHSASESESGARGIGAARRWLVAQLKEIAASTGGRLQVREDWVDLKSERRLPGGTARGANVIARLEGTAQPKRVVVVSGHYDSINSKFDTTRGGIDPAGDAPGADDDASGTAVVVACARALAAMRLPATIEFAAYTAEEQGLLGSEAHAAALKANGAQVELAIANDIVGASRGADGVVRDSYVRLFSPCPNGLDSPARNAARHVAEVSAMYVPGFEARLIFRKDRFGRGGDHLSFDKAGFPSIRFTEPREDYAHQHQNVRDEEGVSYGDLPQHLDFEYLARVARVNAAAIAEWAAAPAAPADVKVAGAVRSDTQVTWAPAEGDAVAGFEAVARRTTSPTWERAFPAGRGPKCNVPALLDDEVVGLRAVGKDGRRSAAVVPAER